MYTHSYVPVNERGTLKQGVATGTWPVTAQDARCKREWRCSDCGDGLHYSGHGKGHMKKTGPYGDIYLKTGPFYTCGVSPCRRRVGSLPVSALRRLLKQKPAWRPFSTQRPRWRRILRGSPRRTWKSSSARLLPKWPRIEPRSGWRVAQKLHGAWRVARSAKN